MNVQHGLASTAHLLHDNLEHGFGMQRACMQSVWRSVQSRCKVIVTAVVLGCCHQVCAWCYSPGRQLASCNTTFLHRPVRVCAGWHAIIRAWAGPLQTVKHHLLQRTVRLQCFIIIAQRMHSASVSARFYFEQLWHTFIILHTRWRSDDICSTMCAGACI